MYNDVKTYMTLIIEKPHPPVWNQRPALYADFIELTLCVHDYVHILTKNMSTLNNLLILVNELFTKRDNMKNYMEY